MIIILSTHIVGDISSSCKHMALLYNGELAFLGEPEKLVEMADGHVWQIITDDSELQTIKEKFPVVSIIPTEHGWNVQLVAEKLDGYSGNKITPTLEHAYVFFTEFVVPKKYS